MTFDNDDLTQTEDRNLLLDKLVVACGEGTQPSPSAPSDPLDIEPGQGDFTMSADGNTHCVYVPQAYDASHQTPIRLFVWMHGCDGTSANDIRAVASPELQTPAPSVPQTWISLAVGGREKTATDRG